MSRKNPIEFVDMTFLIGYTNSGTSKVTGACAVMLGDSLPAGSFFALL